MKFGNDSNGRRLQDEFVVTLYLLTANLVWLEPIVD
jgi:hypothetical protein